MQRSSGIVQTDSWHAGCVNKTGTAPVSVEGNPLTVSTFQLMVHMPKHHEIGRTTLLHTIQSDGQIPVAPIDMRLFPITATGTVGL